MVPGFGSALPLHLLSFRELLPSLYLAQSPPTVKTHIKVRIPLALCLEWPQCVPIILDTHSVSSDSANKGFPGAAPCC